MGYGTMSSASNSRRPGAAKRHLCELGKPDLKLSIVELGVNILQEAVTEDPEFC
jgi:hypothetical protein